MPLGLKRGTVKLDPYDPAWETALREEKERLATALVGRIAAIEHIGSTSIPGLSAKPIIDIAVAIADLSLAEACVPPLEKLGYIAFGDRENRGDHFFAKGPDACRTHYIHMVQTGSNNWHECLIFRDALRKDNILRDEYAGLKKDLAAKYGQDRQKYTDEKARFIKDVIRRYSG